MILQVIIEVDVDTTDTDIEDMRDEILSAAHFQLGVYPGNIEIQEQRTRN